jgi:ABC-type glycerol-3-phosphate transport system substrate-binding protein
MTLWRKVMKRAKLIAVCTAALILFASPVFATGKTDAAAPGAPAVTTLKWALWDYDLTVYYKPLIEAWEAKTPT